ncbi:MAG TPA: metallopeptidase TldD-related protein [Baekduia sp.]|uniref:metallopeptidase TldD-related protein n=1 Tax=Baekduia sp. TaxID=2600305 RepID=UPI002CD7DBEB|nr:metallopeptidase TldD-related protein [Baekduia sp.]HMJ33410.1 metallopeptidase TldD-related protein [Baekduia sp.]
MNGPLELSERALAFLQGEGQATVTRERSLLLRYASSAPTQATELDDTSIHLLSLRNGHVGAATTNVSTDEALRNAARRAMAAAEAAARAAAGPGDHPGLPAPPEGYRAHDGYDPVTARIDPAPGGAALQAAFDVAAEHGLEAFGAWTSGAVETALTSTAGMHAVDRVTDAYLKTILRDARGRTGWDAQSAAKVGDLDATAGARRAAAKVTPEEPTVLPPGEYPVVLDADAVGGLLEFLGSLAFNGQAHAEGRGALEGRLGTRVAAPAINLSDSPRYARTLPRAFDFEGVPKAPIPLIQDGVAHRVVHDTRSAALAGGGARSTGHAITPGGDHHGPTPTNLVLVGGGAADVAELAAPVERGIYVTRLWYLNVVHPQQTLLTGTTRDGTFLIEDGRIARPLRDVRFTDSVLRLLETTEALSATPRLTSEGEYYGRRFAWGTVAPALRAQGFRVTG